MEALFLRFFNMGLTGSAVILAVCLARLALRRAPKAMACALWAVVLFRLLCPVSFSSGFSALGLVGAPVRELRGAASAVEFVAPREAVLSPAPAPVSDIQAAETPATAVTEPARGPDITALLTGLWAAGALGMAAWGLWDYLRLRRRLVGAAELEKGVYVSDYIDSAFVLGPFRPRIYLPSALEGRSAASSCCTSGSTPAGATRSGACWAIPPSACTGIIPSSGWPLSSRAATWR